MLRLDQLNPSPSSPLNAIRLSFNNENAANSRRKSRDVERKIASSRRNTFDNLLAHNSNKDDFSFDLNIDNETNLNLNQSKDLLEISKKSAYTSEEIKKVNELATIFLDTRRVFKADSNIVDPLNGSGAHDSNHKKVHVSRAGYLRAEKVKSMLALKYIYIQRQYDWKENNQEAQGLHNGVEGVYNPLQIIRNRKIRAKYHEYPKTLTMKTLPLASNVFSKHSRNKKIWKMVWSVELDEFLSDSAWRITHWHELVNPKGEYWFPDNSSPSASKSVNRVRKHRSGHIRKRLHDKLFTDEKTDDETRHTRTGSSNQSDSNGTLASSKSSSGKNVSSKTEKRSKKIYNSNSSSNLEDLSSVVDSTSDVNNSHGNLKQMIIQPVSKPPAEDEEEEPLSFSPQKRNGDAAIPTIKIDALEDVLSVVSIRSVKKNSENLDASLSDEEAMCEKKHLKVLEGRDLELNQILSQYNYMDQFFRLRLNFLLSIYPRYTEAVNKQLDFIMNEQVSDILQSTVRINDQYLLSFETLFLSFSDEIEAVIHLINDDHSIRVDNLLSSSDRSIGELNTSLSSEVRKVGERIDKLKSSLCNCNILSRTKDDSHYKMNMHDSNYKALYSLLENFIVVTLRFIWAFVNIYKVFANIFRFLWRIIRYFVF